MLRTDEYVQYDAIGLAGLIQSGETTASELLECALSQAETLNPALNAITAFDTDNARNTARAQDEIKPGNNSLLAGVPFLIKDISAVKGLPQSRGSALFSKDVATEDSQIASRFREAGLIIFGKTNTPELCLTITTESAYFGPCRNPLAPEYSTGGSSGGAAAAVAAGIVPAAHGSDGGGSIRVPAACCGLFGLKPSRGLTVIEKEVGSSWSGLSVNHVLTRSVRDSAAFLDALRLTQPGLYPLPDYRESYYQTHAAKPGQLRIALQQEHPAGEPVHADCRAALEYAAALCRSHGHAVQEQSPPVDYQALTRAMITLVNTHVAEVIGPQLQKTGLSLEEAPLETATRRMAASGARVTACDYLAALDTIRQAERSMQDFHQQFDIILSPVLAQPPAKLGWLDMNSDDLKTYGQRFAGYGGFAALYNGTGQPSATLPLHRNAAGLPIGVMISAAWGEDHRLLQLAGQLLNI